MTGARPRVVIVGGGAFGSAIAYRLARAGHPVTVVEREPDGPAASQHNAGNLNPVLGTPPALVPLARRAFRMHREWVDRLREDGVRPHALQPVVRLLVALDVADTERFEAVEAALDQHEGFSARRLDAPAIARRVPGLGAEIQAALELRGSLALDPSAFLGALREGARAHGARRVLGTVRGLEARSAGMSRVRVDDRWVEADVVVLATGAFTAQLSDWLGVSLPVEPVMGQMLYTRMPRGRPPIDLTWGETCLYRRRDDEVWIGTTKEHVGMDVTPTEAAASRLLGEATRVLPAVRDAEVLSHTAALRPCTPSGLPIVARLDDPAYVIVANGGGPKGMLLSTGVAELVHALIETGHLTDPQELERVR